MILRTIRIKLLALVLLPLLLLIGMLGVTERVLEGQLLGEAERRVWGAQRALQIQLDDDLRELKGTLLYMAGSQRMKRALDTGDVELAARIARRFAQDHPGLAFAMAAPSGEVLLQVGLGGVSRLADMGQLKLPESEGQVAKTLLPKGCDGRGSSFARALATLSGDSGLVIACQVLDDAFLKHAAEKLGLGLALLDARNGRRIVARTKGFPEGAPPERGETVLHDDGRALWAVAHFCPGLFPDAPKCDLDAMSALSVTQTRDLLRRDFLVVILIVLGLGALALLLGGRLALRMTRAIERIVHGYRGLTGDTYPRIEVVKTGDELEELGHGFNQMVEGLEERDRLKTTFGKYMTDTLVSHLIANQVQLGGDTLPVTVLFSDIRGFTSISEKLDAQSLVSLLNEYFTEMVDIVMEHGGVVDKYIGDAIMVVFGAPVPRDDDAVRAVRAAICMRQALSKLNERLTERGVPPILTGIGIHSGDVVAGNIGSERRMEYTVIGDAVNLASRLEGATKELGADIVISDATYALVRHEIAADFLCSTTVKGRAQAVDVYAVRVPEAP